jgi:hypothetical protein
MQIQVPFPHTFSIDFNLIKFGDIDEVLTEVRIEIAPHHFAHEHFSISL